MRLHQSGDIRYFTFDQLSEVNVPHAVFTRRGGVSPHPWESLNVGGLVGDEPSRVLENRRRSFQAVGRKLESMYDVWQVHGAEVVYADSPRPLDVMHRKADAILTDRVGVTLFMRFADCVPIFLYDPLRRVVALVHAGWMGTVRLAARAAVVAMQEKFHSSPGDILAAIGPSIAAHHYEVGTEVAEQVTNAFGVDANTLLVTANGNKDRVQFDLWEANRLILEHCGLRQIEMAGVCTACHTQDWYSHRGEKGQTGRFGVLIGL